MQNQPAQVSPVPVNPTNPTSNTYNYNINANVNANSKNVGDVIKEIKHRQDINMFIDNFHLLSYNSQKHKFSNIVLDAITLQDITLENIVSEH